MASPALVKYQELCVRPRSLITDNKLNRLNTDARRNLYLLSVVGYVAAWQAYWEDLLKNFLHYSGPLFTGVDARLHQIVTDQANDAIKRFRSPYPKNINDLFHRFAGLKPADHFKYRAMTNSETREALNDMVDLRHQVAHGVNISVPLFLAARSSVWLGKAEVNKVDKFLTSIANKADVLLANHLNKFYPCSPSW